MMQTELPQMLPVQSAHMKRLGYDAEKSELFIQFMNGGTYKYLDVPQIVYEQAMSASSKGKFFHRSIKGKFESEVVEFPF